MLLKVYFFGIIDEYKNLYTQSVNIYNIYKNLI
jgi:hypothetical protein